MVAWRRVNERPHSYQQVMHADLMETTTPTKKGHVGPQERS